MSKVSVIIPSRNDKFLNNTIQDMLAKAAGEVEVVAVVDGPTDCPLPKEHPALLVLQLPEARGMRNGINAGAARATGKYLLKADSHCSMSEGYDVLLQAECEKNWLVIGRRNELNESWEISDTTPCDYWYLSCPWTAPQGYMRDCRWVSRQRERVDLFLDETMTISGSMWFMSKVHFECIGGMDDCAFGPWSGEPQELSGKTWLSGGRVMVNKRVTYAHLRPGKGVERGYHISWKHALRGLRAVTQYWMNDRWPGRIHDFGWWVERFWPLPLENTRMRGEKYFWEPDWREKYYHA